MPDGLHVDPQLMRSPGFRHKSNPGLSFVFANDPPLGLCGFAVRVIDDLKRPVRPVNAKRQINKAFALGHLSPDSCDVCLADMAPLELQAEVPLGVTCQGKNHHP